MPKRIIVIVGPTASGKSELAVILAEKFNGEVISADSRQVYKGMNIGTGKITKEEMRGISHYCLNVVSPKRKFTVIQFRKLALSAINKILERRKIPVLCGGTNFYIQIVIDGLVIPEVKPDWELRQKLNKKPIKELYQILKKLDPRRAQNIEKTNPRRLIRAIEIVMKTEKPVPPLKISHLPYRVLMIGIDKPPEELKKLIQKRLLKRLKKGMIAEAKRLKESGLSWKRMEEFGLEYRFTAQYLQGKISRGEMIEKIQRGSERYAKKQMFWLKKDKRIRWIQNNKGAEKLAKSYLK